MDELKKCPFCGEPFNIIHRGESEWLRYFVQHNRHCLMAYHFENVVGYTDINLVTKELNTRPLEDALIAKLEKAKEAINKALLVCADNDGILITTMWGILRKALARPDSVTENAKSGQQADLHNTDEKGEENG